MVKCISLERLRMYIQFHEPYHSYDSYRKHYRKQWPTSRTVCELHIIRGTSGVYTSPRLVRVMKQWFTSRTVGEVFVIGRT